MRVICNNFDDSCEGLNCDHAEPHYIQSGYKVDFCVQEEMCNEKKIKVKCVTDQLTR